MIFGQSCAVAGTEAYSDGPRYRRGNGFAFGAVTVGIIVSGLLQLWLARQNSRKRREQYTEKAATLRPLGIEEIWDDHPDFFYQL